MQILREKQKDVKQNHESEAEQANMWRDLEKIMKVNKLNKQVNSYNFNPYFT